MTLRHDGEELVLVVEDDGPGIPAADRELVFERFTRLDEARGRADGGRGSASPSCAAVVEHHGGTVRRRRQRPRRRPPHDHAAPSNV